VIVTTETEPEPGRYFPVRYPEEEPFWAAADEEQLVLQRCDECGKVRYPIGPVCPECLSPNYTWTEMSGRGEVTTYVVYHRPWAPWLKNRVPYVVVQVQLEEGPRLTTNLLDIAPEDVHVGLAVEVAFEHLPDITLYQFRPVSSASNE
jgi:uncharacterized protein